MAVQRTFTFLLFALAYICLKTDRKWHYYDTFELVFPVFIMQGEIKSLQSPGNLPSFQVKHLPDHILSPRFFWLWDLKSLFWITGFLRGTFDIQTRQSTAIIRPRNMKSYFIRPLVWVITPPLFLTSVSERIQLGHISLINESLGDPVPLLWSGLCTCCNLPRLMEEGQPGSLSISTQRGEKWKQLICTDLNNLPPWKKEKKKENMGRGERKRR